LDEFVIIANRGLWDYVSYQTAVDIAQGTEPMIAAQKLRDFAIGCGAEGSTMIMVIGVADLFRGASTVPAPDKRKKRGPQMAKKSTHRPSQSPPIDEELPHDAYGAENARSFSNDSIGMQRIQNRLPLRGPETLIFAASPVDTSRPQRSTPPRVIAPVMRSPRDSEVRYSSLLFLLPFS
jgi:hypothetical protein